MTVNNKNVVLIKLGGGLIAPKDWEPETPDKVVINRLIGEIDTAVKKTKYNCIVVCGSGNYGHKAVKRYGTDTAIGAAKVQAVAAKIGQVVVEAMGEQGLAATLVAPHDIYVADGNGTALDNSEIIASFLDMGLIPVLYGDVVWDKTGKAVICSGETNIKRLIPTLIGKGWRVQKIIQAGKEDGVWDGKKKIIPEIKPSNWEDIQKDVFGTAGGDATGGMKHKVEESLEIAQKCGVETHIVSGCTENTLEKIFEGKRVVGTKITT